MTGPLRYANWFPFSSTTSVPVIKTCYRQCAIYDLIYILSSARHVKDQPHSSLVHLETCQGMFGNKTDSGFLDINQRLPCDLTTHTCGMCVYNTFLIASTLLICVFSNDE